MPPKNVDEVARVAAHTSIPIVSGDRLATRYEFSHPIEKPAARIIQLDVGQCGGILEAKKLAGIAEAHFAMIAPHMYVGPVAASAAVQFETCSPNFLLQEWKCQLAAPGDSRRADQVRERLHHVADRPPPRAFASRRLSAF